MATKKETDLHEEHEKNANLRSEEDSLYGENEWESILNDEDVLSLNDENAVSLNDLF